MLSDLAGILDADQAVAFAQAHAQGLAYTPPAWPMQVIANAEVAQAIALGADIAGDGSIVTPPAPPTGGSTGGAGSGSDSGSGGGAMAPVELATLALCAFALGRRR